ncbi:nitrous oxide reductase family maturation protein NosD [Shewanella sp.]|uniref:nitrous oxide reductase family maturation protein NosD n=1 Tax=Shewanella sp. TaxID=50422 RepID=UPI003569A8E4
MAWPVMGGVIQVSPTSSLQQSMDEAPEGAVLNLGCGTYRGNFIVNKALHLKAEKPHCAQLDAGGTGHGLLLKASGIKIEGLSLVHWGRNLTTQDAGIYSDQQASQIVIRNNRLQGDGFGIWLQKGQNIEVIGNHIRGNTELRSADRGNGIQLSSVQQVRVEANDVANTRDGIYIISSQHNTLQGNTMHDLRYGIHYMYSHSNTVVDNLAYNTRAGYALMSSRNLTVEGNQSKDSEDYGFLMNFITSSNIRGNRISNVWTKPENKVVGREGKGFFVYNSAYNNISFNTVDTAEIGIHLTAGSEETRVFGNNFINNPVQVKFVSNTPREWSEEGTGNFWSNYLGWDLDGDGRGDTAFEPNDGIDGLVWKYPEAKILLDSPAVLMLRYIQRQFPVLRPPGVRDSFPMMNPISDESVSQALTARSLQ